MRDFEVECMLVGKRIEVTTSKGSQLGTYVWKDVILLDTGHKLCAKSHKWTRAKKPHRAPDISITLPNNTRAFSGDHIRSNATSVLEAGRKLVIEKLECKPWNHGGYLAGKIKGEDTLWVLISEIEIPVYDMF